VLHQDTFGDGQSPDAHGQVGSSLARATSALGPIIISEPISIRKTEPAVLPGCMAELQRVWRPRSARCKKRGASSSSTCGVARVGTHGPIRLSISVSHALRMGPPPIHLPRTATGHNRMTRSPGRSPSRGAACGFWIRAWSHASPLSGNRPLEQLGIIAGLARGWAGQSPANHANESSL
jgi:hypothetical protein